MHDVDHQPRLTWWSHVWRYALAVAIGVTGWFEVAEWQAERAPWWFWTDLLLGIGTCVLVWWRRRHPMVVNVVAALACFVSWSAAGPAVLALVSLATRRRWREIIPVSLLTVGASFTVSRFGPQSDESIFITAPVAIAAVAVAVGWGMYIGSRRELMATLRERAHTAESEQAARVAQARTAERARIAREMHDVLAHRISMVTMHAGALTYRSDLTAEEMRTTAGVIQENSHQALVELREVLGILRDGPGDAAPELPQPSAADLPELIDEARQAGMRIETERGIELEGVPESLGRTLYRIVQEGLTNARKHAADTLVVVNLDGGPEDGLWVEVRNLLPIGSRVVGVPESGLGLVGLAERTALAGGRMSHRITAGREFILQAWLPWPA